jgi:GDP-L-fucose synthase
MTIKNRIYVAGHKGMVGSALLRILEKNKKNQLITADRNYLDLTNQTKVKNFFKKKKINEVYIAAAKVGGIYANNNFPAEFIYENIMIQSNIIHAAFLYGVKKILFLGSSCIYPRTANQPMKEKALLTGMLEPTNEPYAIAKISGVKMCESYNRQYGASHKIDYRSIMPTNLFGPNDNYSSVNSHVIPALIRRFHEAKINNSASVTIWGNGKTKREFLFVDDMARAAVHVMNLDNIIFHKHINPMCSHINVGSGIEFTIKELTEIIKKVVGYSGKIKFDSTKLDGSPRKLLNTQLLNKLGWKPKVRFKDGLIKTYEDFIATQCKL